MMRSLWARITGKDKGETFPNQQTSALGRIGNDNIIFPYGLYCDLPDGSRTRTLGNGYSISSTVKRPDDLSRGEPVFFHPETNTRIIPRADGSLDIETGSGGTAPVNINCTQANITASSSVTVDTPAATFTGNVQIDGNLGVSGNATVIGTMTAGIVSALTSLLIGGLEMLTHKHSQANDSGGSIEQDTGGPHA